MDIIEDHVPIAITKITPPPLQDRVVIRRYLDTRLDSTLGHTPHTVILSTPPGYGKTTFVRSWIKTQRIETVWVTLDRGDNEPIRFFSYLVAALSRIDDKLGSALKTLLSAPKNPSPESFAVSFINHTANMKHKVVCVFDDYHTISSHHIHIFMQTLIENLPPNLLILILSRVDPPLTLGRMRLHNRLTELRIEDLRMNRGEMEEFFTKTMDIPLSPACFTILEDRIEGWTAGLLLAGLSIQQTSHRDAEALLKEISGRHTYIIEYLTEEVLNSLSDDARRFLYATSVLDAFCDELCNAIMARSDSKEVLTELAEANIFLLSMDNQGKWYRYHPLFANYLQTNVENEQRNRIYVSASQWFRSKNITESAVSYALRAEKTDLAVPLILEEAEKIFMDGRYSVLLSWIDSFSPQILREKPELSFYKAWGTFAAGSVEAAGEIIEHIENQNDVQISRRIIGRIDVLKALIAEARHEEKKIDLIRTALSSIDPGDRYLKALLFVQNGIHNFHEDELEKAEIFFLDALEIGREIWNQFLIAVSVFNLSYVYAGLDRQEEAARLCEKYLKESAKDSGLPATVMTILYLPLAAISSNTENREDSLALAKKTFETVIHFNFNFLLLVNINTAIKSLKILPDIAEAASKHEAGKFGTIIERQLKSEQNSLPDPISRRELEILKLLGKGFSNNDIAGGLFISIGTVKWHLNNIFDKMDVKNRTQAANRARELNLI